MNLKELLELKTKHNDTWFTCTTLFISQMETMNDEYWDQMIQLWNECESMKEEIKRRTEEIDADDGMRFVTNTMKRELINRVDKVDKVDGAE